MKLQQERVNNHFCVGTRYILSDLESTIHIFRRKLAEEQCNQEAHYPDPDPLVGQVEFYGQRPWRSGRLDPVDMQREKEGVLALQHRERTLVRHSQLIIGLQAAALKQFELFSSPRMRTEVEVQMVEELMIDQQYDVALTTLLPCIQVYRSELWTSLATAVLLKALKCAFLTMNVGGYLGLCLELAGPDSTCPEAEKARIRQNLYLVLDLKVPLPEPSLTTKSERAAVGQASRSWRDTLDGLPDPVTVDTSSFRSLIEVSLAMPPSAKVGEAFSLVVCLRNHAPDQSFVVTELACRLSVSDHEPGCRREDAVSLPAGGAETRFEFSIRPSNVEVGTCLQVHAVMFKLEQCSQVILVKTFPTPTTTEIHKGPTVSDLGRSSVRIGTRDSNVEVRFLGQEPLLVGEWFPLRLELVSGEPGPVSDIEVPVQYCKVLTVMGFRISLDPLRNALLWIAPGEPSTYCAIYRSKKYRKTCVCLLKSSF